MIQGADRMIQMRLRGCGFVSAWLYVGNYAPDRAEKRFPWWAHGTDPYLYLKTPSEFEDLRPLVGVHTWVTAERYSEQLFKFCERLQTYSKTVGLLIEDWDTDPGNVIWFDKNGTVTLEALHG